jgi:Major Facilitator Superfamily
LGGRLDLFAWQSRACRNKGVVVRNSSARRATFGEVFAVREFRALWASQVLSVCGDRLALVALTLLIYDRTRSPLLAAVAYAAGYVPYALGAVFLSGLADRMPRRQVMVACDVIRAVLVTAMLAPGMPLDAMVALLYVTTAVQPPFDAARSAILGDIVGGERYALAAATMQTTFRVTIVAGAAAAGVTVAFAGARFALGIDAATFLASAVIIQLGTHSRPAAVQAAVQADGKAGSGALAQLGAGIRVVFGDRALRALVLFGWLAALYEFPEGIAAPYANKLGGGPVAVGLLIASAQVGSALAMPIFVSRVGPLRRLRWMGPMAWCACAVLLLTLLRPGIALTMVIFALSGAFATYQVAANTEFVARIPNERRAQAFGLANAGLIVGQGVAFAVAGAAAEVVPPSTVVALGGGFGAVVALALALRWRRISPAIGRHSARHFRSQVPLAGHTPVQAAAAQALGRVVSGRARGHVTTGRAPHRAANRQAPVHAARSRVRG